MALTQATDVWDQVDTAAIVRTLGSRHLKNVQNNADLMGATRRGLPIDVMTALQRIGFTIDELARITANSSRTINRLVASRDAKARLSLATSNGAVRLAAIVTLGELLLGSKERAVRWLRTENRYLGNIEPLTMLETEMGRDLVVESLYAIAFGAVG